LSTADQHRVFAPHTGRRIVLATNVAETSLTVPGIKYVIDPGTARISRYSHRLKVQRLPIEPVSQASANQRAGRCGRTSDGICIRLYSEADFQARPEFTEPEILRTNLASVILQMTALNLTADPADVAHFGFIDPPDRRQVTDGVALLHELGALDQRKLTPTGRRLAQLPIDPRLGRMVLEAERNGCVREVLVIAAALSIQDPRERPAEQQQQAAQQHARFKADDSDFVSYLNLWNYLQEKQKELSSNQFRKLCKAEFLHYLRVREWQDLFVQLRQATRGLGIALSTAPEAADRIHQSLLAGLLSHVGMYEQEKREYAGARNARFAIFPGSALFRRGPAWVMAAELVETSRLWARVVAKIQPEWIEPLATHLVRRSYSEPHWEKSQGSVMAYEKVTLYGVPIVARRRVNYGRIDAALSRELFIRHALVEGDWLTRHDFFHDNRALLDEVEELEHRVRRRDILVDDEALFAFYDQRVPADVVSGRHFDAWWKRARRATPDLLSFEKSMLIAEGSAGARPGDFPDTWVQGALTLPLTYQFEPGAAADGVTVHVPLALLNQVHDDFDWQVPGLREDLIIALIRSLPKALRRNFVPVPDFAGAAMEALGTQAPGAQPLLGALEAELRRMTGVLVSRGDWDLAKVADHLRMTISVEDEAGKPVATGKDLEALRETLRPKVRETLAETFATPTGVAARAGTGATAGSKAGSTAGAAADEQPAALERGGLRAWPGGALPRTLTRRRGAYDVTAYPALADEGDSVAVRLYETPDEQERAMRAGTRRLLLLTVASPAKFVALRLNNAGKLVLSHNPHGGVAALMEDCAGAAVDEIVAEHGGPAWDEAGFAALATAVRGEINLATMEIVTDVQRILAAAHELEVRLKGTHHAVFAAAIGDLTDQLGELIYPGFVTATGGRRLPDVLRYLRAALRRLEKVAENPARDRSLTEQLDEVRREYEDLLRELPAARRGEDAVRDIHWMIQELRVSYFAQVLGTAYPISDKRIYRAMDAL
jgi:ATP-dependent helicase HrpA